MSTEIKVVQQPKLHGSILLLSVDLPITGGQTLLSQIVCWSRHDRSRIGIAAVGLALAIKVTAPNYLTVQCAVDADAFRKAIGEVDRSRVGAAALIDVGFATSYALFAASFVKWPRAGTRIGAAIVAGGAAGDVLENLLLLFGVVRLDRLSDGPVKAMRVCGAAKWAGITVGAVVLAIDGFRCHRLPGSAAVT